jgi:GH43 family beta-xylosidase
MIKTNIENLRDPFVLVEPDGYYVYGTGVVNKDWNNTIWACYKNTGDSLDGEWVMTDELVYVRPEYAQKNLWAPEVHKYNGYYYMFATYYSSLTNRRGCTILKSDSPQGPFVEITNGHITPKEWDAIDGTLWVDENGQPWMVFVHEWISTVDRVGTMAVAKLSDDFTHFISEPVELFRADSPSWTDKYVTDGCFMYKTKDNQLLMLWSNFHTPENDYCVGIARSKNGKVDGEWIHDEKLLFSKETTGKYDGGHGMIFTDRDGKMYLSVHSPNKQIEGCGEKTIFIPVHEENGTLVCDM